jgi:hypothetical protein
MEPAHARTCQMAVCGWIGIFELAHALFSVGLPTCGRQTE